MVDWPYAQLVVDAQEAGGPYLFKQSLIDFGYEEGQASMVKWVGIAAIGGALTVSVISRFRAYFNKKKEEKRQIEKKLYAYQLATEVLQNRQFNKRPILINIVG